jgi:hypothetical protein
MRTIIQLLFPVKKYAEILVRIYNENFKGGPIYSTITNGV